MQTLETKHPRPPPVLWGRPWRGRSLGRGRGWGMGWGARGVEERKGRKGREGSGPVGRSQMVIRYFATRCMEMTIPPPDNHFMTCCGGGNLGVHSGRFSQSGFACGIQRHGNLLVGNSESPHWGNFESSRPREITSLRVGFRACTREGVSFCVCVRAWCGG